MAILDVLNGAIPAQMRRFVMIAMPILVLLSSCDSYVAGELGPPPLTSQVVDAETGQPLEGVVVLAFWTRCSPSLGGWAGCGFFDAEEVVTGADGRYAIRRRFTYEIPLVTRVSGPELVIFKPGYGQPQRRLSGGTALMALPPLRTRAERLEALDWIHDPVVPPQYKPRLEEAIRRERAYLGLW